MLLDILGVEYNYHYVDLLKGEQKTPEFLKINPQHNTPVLKDENICMNESGPIMIYLAEKYQEKNKNLFPMDNMVTRARIQQRIGFASTTLSTAFVEAYVNRSFRY